jgi:hypothetical protein
MIVLSILNANGWYHRVPSPPWSPDNSRPVEQAHRTTKRLFKECRKPLPLGARMEGFMQHIRDIVQEYVTVQSIKQDVATLQDMWKALAANPNQTVVDSKARGTVVWQVAAPPHHMT